jgi:hypothetical protein
MGAKKSMSFLAFAPLDLVGALEGGVDLLHDLGHRVHRVQALVGVHLAVAVGVAGHLPAAQVDGLQAGLDLLHGLVAGQRAEAVDEGLGVDQVPQLLGAALGQRVLDGQAAAQAHHVGGGVAALDAFPAGVLGPVLFEGGDLLLAGEVSSSRTYGSRSSMRNAILGCALAVVRRTIARSTI